MSALPPAGALALARRLVEASGFRLVARNTRGDSLYLARAEGGPTLRLSNHARRPRPRRGHPEVATSLVIREPRSEGQVAAMVAVALRTFDACCERVALNPEEQSKK